MIRNRIAHGLAGGVALVLLLSASPALPQSEPAPIATYWMTARTSVGMPGMGGGRPDPMAMMAAMSGGSAPQHDLLLQLGSTQTPTGAASADHLPPAGLKAGDRLPLVGVKRSQGAESSPGQELPRDTPRLIVYYGCGEAGRAPITYQLSQDGGRQFAAMVAAHRVVGQKPPSPETSRSYGEWPNSRGRQQRPSGSLVGEHVVRGNYTPDIRFNLNAGQDFLAPLHVTGTGGSGAHRLQWNAIPNAKGYLLYAFGQNKAGDMVVWSSSDVPSFPLHIPELLAPADLARLQAAKVILPVAATSCTIPAAMTAAAPEAMLRVIAFGGEVNMAFPPRPADRRIPWKVESVVKVRYNSTAGMVLGMESDGDVDSDQSIEEAGPGGLVGSAIGSLFGRKKPKRQ
ncbi:MAG: hypothetical protein EOP63_05870 [Sphingomonadales bacterium]|nr:MAG: hypothetical protein EOP63_05870 [Sphingomonadales bacterium]